MATVTNVNLGRVAGSKWYTGTGITGTSTTGSVFSGSGVANARVGDLYLNTALQNIYECTVAGAASVAKWVYKCNIKGEDGGAGNNGYGTCTTAANTVAKVASLANSSFSLATGTSVAILFTNQSASDPMTLNVNGTGAKAIKMKSVTTNLYWAAGSLVNFRYDGTVWQVADQPVYYTGNTIGSKTGGNIRTHGTGVEIYNSNSNIWSVNTQKMVLQNGSTGEIGEYDSSLTGMYVRGDSLALCTSYPPSSSSYNGSPHIDLHQTGFIEIKANNVSINDKQVSGAPITARLASTATVYVTGTLTKIPFTSVAPSTTAGFTLSSNGLRGNKTGIVEVSAYVYFEGLGPDQNAVLELQIGTTKIAQCIMGAPAGGLMTMSFPPMTANITANQIITLHTRSGSGGGGAIGNGAESHTKACLTARYIV